MLVIMHWLETQAESPDSARVQLPHFTGQNCKVLDRQRFGEGVKKRPGGVAEFVDFGFIAFKDLSVLLFN